MGVFGVEDYKSDVRIAKFKKAKVYKSTRAAGQFIQLQRLLSRAKPSVVISTLSSKKSNRNKMSEIYENVVKKFKINKRN